MTEQRAVLEHPLCPLTASHPFFCGFWFRTPPFRSGCPWDASVTTSQGVPTALGREAQEVLPLPLQASFP